MTQNDGGSKHVNEGLRQVIAWYGTPVGLVFAVGILSALLAAFLDLPRLGLIIVCINVAIVVPWKFARQHQEFLAHARATSEAQLGFANQLSNSVSRPGLQDMVEGFRRADREHIRKLKARVLHLEQAHDEELASLRSEVGRLRSHVSGDID